MSAELAQEVRILKETVQQMFPNAQAEMDAITQQFQGLKSRFPVTPNLLADTYSWETFCGGQRNVPTDIIQACSTSMFSATFYGGTAGSGTITVLPLTELANNGCPFGEDLAIATSGDDETRPWYGSDWSVLLIDLVLSGPRSDGSSPYFFIRSPSSPKQSGYNKGQQKMQTHAFVNVISHEGSITGKIPSNMLNGHAVGAGDADKGWQLLRNVQTGCGGMMHLFDAIGLGHIKMAIALPYAGAGDHGGTFFWADTIQPAELATTTPNNHIYTHKMG